MKPTRRKCFPLFACLLLTLVGVIALGGTWRHTRLERGLIAAIQRNDTSTSLLLLKRGANPNAEAADTRNVTLLDACKRLLRRSPAVTNRRTALMLAVQSNNTVVVQALLNGGAQDTGGKLRADDGSGDEVFCTLLMYAAAKGNVAIARALIQHGSNVKATDENGKTALNYAGNVAVVDALVKSGANVNGRDKNGFSIVSSYVYHGNLDTLRALLMYGPKDRNAMELAVHRDYEGECLRVFLAAGWDVDMKDEDGWSPLITALYSPGRLSPANAMLLIKHGANVNFRLKDGQTPLLFAADGGRYPPMDRDSPKLVQALLDRGAQINATDNKGFTPLMIASWRLRPVLVRQLLRQGARVNARTKDGRTALSMARHSPYTDTHEGCQPVVMRLLRQAGAKQ